MQTQNVMEEARRIARQMGLRELPEDMAEAIMGSRLAMGENLPGPGYPRSLAFASNPLLDPGWDADLDELPPGLMTLTGMMMTSVRVTKDGVVKVTRHGHNLVRETLEKMGDPLLADAIREHLADKKSLKAMEEEVGSLDQELADLRRTEQYGPQLLQRAIRRYCPVGTAGKFVDIVPRSNVAVGDNTKGYILYADRQPQEFEVPGLFGADIMDRKAALKKVSADIASKSQRRQDLQLQIHDLREALPDMEARIQHLFDGLDPAEVRRQLNGGFIGITLDDRGQPVVLVQRETNEESAEVTPEIKRWLIARHLSGNELSGFALKALGIDGAVEAVTEAIGAPAAAPQVEAPKAEAPPTEPAAS